MEVSDHMSLSECTTENFYDTLACSVNVMS